MQDEYFMSLALVEAEKGRFSTSPNPRVGCVMVKDNQVVSSGYHEVAGGPHAEVVALNGKTHNLQDATVYVTLEPCSHYGRTPPCCQALITLGVKRVVVAMRDPNPLVAGRGIKAMQQEGIEVDVGVCEQEAQCLNRGYTKRMLGKGPWLSGKVALSVDGRMALANGESKWLTGDAARNDVMLVRAQSCAILTGIQTIVTDDPLLNVRILSNNVAIKQPDLIVLDPSLRLSTHAKVLGTLSERKVVVIAGQYLIELDRKEALIQAGCEVHVLPKKSGKICLDALKLWLADTQYNEIMVESGSTLMSALLESELLDELIVYQAPMFLGVGAMPIFQAQFQSLREAKRFRVGACESVGEDLKIQYLLTDC